MPALKKTDITGTITWLGLVRSREEALRSAPVEALQAQFSGVDGEDHGGLTRASCSRVTSQYPKGTTIRNTRQVCIVSAEEMAQIAHDIGIETFNPEWCGANIVISGIPDFTHIPPSSRLQLPGGATLTVDMENRPCHLPAPVIDADAPGHGKAFKAAARGRRGVTAWVEREGEIKLGDTVTLHIPDQRAWQP
ncbi:MOSC domain-containing protein [Litoreibacter ponti]|uniref:MOSC domain-containing protein n=1 Tax=Litoreibacter ponti TaxID=1510457 RepID=A0A2T6BLH4_9RHOB|nr:MOSC domain-containing protein [Litoreibacter ponti]PTX56911.1 MOSC domain-containing protein [Litoreibacter ponti]